MHTGSDGSVDLVAYDRYLGRWSRLFVPALVEAAGIGRGDRVLDVATGPGDAAIAVRSVVGGGGLVIGCDIATGMARAAHQRSGGTLAVVAADGQQLPFGNDTFDAVICQFGLMFFPRPGEALVEFARIARPAGRVAVAVCQHRNVPRCGGCWPGCSLIIFPISTMRSTCRFLWPILAW